MDDGSQIPELPTDQNDQAETSLKWWVYVLVAALSLGGGYGLRKLLNTPSVEGDSPARLEFSLEALDREVAGGRIEAEDFEGRVLVVDFWATWCQPCKAQAEVLESLQQRYPAERVAFLAIDVEEPREVVEAYVEDHPLAYPVALDLKGAMSPRYGVYGLPTVLIAGQDGVVEYLKVGLSSEGELRRAIDRLLTKS